MSIILDGLAYNYDPSPVDEYERATKGEERARLDNLAIHLEQNNINMIGFVAIKVLPSVDEKAIQKRVKEIKQFLFEKRKYPRDHFVILVGRSDRTVTTLWVWPRNEQRLFCDSCKVY